MKSRAAFIEDIDPIKPMQVINEKVHNTSEKPTNTLNAESRLVNDFHMHLQNKERMQNLMVLLGK